MASYPPPNYIEPLPIFNTTNWIPNTSTAGSGGALDPRYLRFPVAQGTESFNDLISVGTANLTNISIDDPTSVSSSSISQSTAGILTIDNNEATSGSIVFKANNSGSAEQTILTLSGDTGTTATLPITANGGLTANALTCIGNATLNTATLSNTLQIFNGVNSSTLDMDGSNNLLINNNTDGALIYSSVKDATRGISNALSFSTGGGLASRCLLPNNIPTDPSNFICFTASSVATTTGLQICVTPNSGTYNNLVQSNDPFMVGTGAGSNLGSLVLTTWSSSRLGVRINSNSGIGAVNSVEVAGALIALNATTSGGLTSSTTITSPTDNSTKIPTTAWVQSAITSNPAIIPYYQTTCFFRNLAYGRSANIVFNFSGPAWGLNDFFTINFRYEVNSVLTASVSTQPTTDFTIVSGSVDIYPYRCPVNVATDTAYGIGQASTTPANFPQFNNNIYKPSISGYSSAFDLGTNDPTYYPYGRYFWVTNYSITQQGTQYSQTSPTNGLLPLQPYVPTGSVAQQAFGFALWNYNTTSTYTQYNNLFLQLVNRGANPITITGNYLVFADATVKTSGF